MEISVTSLGIVSAIGMDIHENYTRLLAEKTGISKIELLDDLEKSFLGGEIKLNNSQLSEIIFKTGKGKELPRSLLLSLIAAKQAWGSNKSNKNIRTAIIGGTTIGGMDLTENYLKENKNIKSLIHHPCGEITEYLSNYFEITDFKTTISTACSSTANAVMLASRLIKNNMVDRVLVGGGDALTSFTVNGFNSLRIYDNDYCKPYDNNRNGLNLGEAAGYIVLENEKSLSLTYNKRIASILGWGNANDAYHQTASSPEGEGAQESMKDALKVANLKSNEIDYINAHGTATNNNDLSEGRAIEKIFGKDQLYSSTKAYTGHTLAAAGIVELIFSILSIQYNTIFPVLNYENKMKELESEPIHTIKQNKEINTVLSNSFGFGGNNATIIIGK
jgi:3-oxoacyl-(acyl-carrier-protein) synthase